MKAETNEFSFILKPSPIGGVGVFATHDIKQDTYLRLFGDEKILEGRTRIIDANVLDSDFKKYCMYRDGGLMVCPEDFGQMQIGWYLNHSIKNANALHKNYFWYATRDIKAGEEILIDYNTLEEPIDYVEEYYNE